MKVRFPRKSKPFARSAALWLFLLAAASAFADNSKISPDILPLLSNPSNNINVIVQYYTPPTGGLLGGLLGGVLNLVGGVLKTVFSLIPAVSAILHPSDVIAISNQSNVAYISLDRPLRPSSTTRPPPSNAPSAWNLGLDGTGVGVAVIDSGIYPHPDLNCRQLDHRASSTARASSGRADSTITGTARTSPASWPAMARLLRRRLIPHVPGIAPNANLIDLRVLDGNGMSNDSAVIAAIDTRHPAEEQVQHPRHQSVAGPADLRELHAAIRSARPWKRPGRAASWWWSRPATLGPERAMPRSLRRQQPDVITVGAMKTMDTPARPTI